MTKSALCPLSPPSPVAHPPAYGARKVAGLSSPIWSYLENSESESFVCDQEQTAQLDVALKKIGSAAQVLLIMIVIKN